MVEIISKDYNHFNRALGKQINSKKQYKEECKRQGMVTSEKGNDIAHKAKESNRNDYKPSKDTAQFYASLNKTKDGKVKLSGRQLEFMKKKGVSFKRPDYKGIEGGFS